MQSDWMSRRWVLWLVPILAIGFSALIYLLDPPLLQTARHAVFDQFQRWQPSQAAPNGVRVVDVDEASLATYGQWPWPRTRLVELVQQDIRQRRREWPPWGEPSSLGSMCPPTSAPARR